MMTGCRGYHVICWTPVILDLGWSVTNQGHLPEICTLYIVGGSPTSCRTWVEF